MCVRFAPCMNVWESKFKLMRCGLRDRSDATSVMRQDRIGNVDMRKCFNVYMIRMDNTRKMKQIWKTTMDNKRKRERLARACSSEIIKMITKKSVKWKVAENTARRILLYTVTVEKDGLCFVLASFTTPNSWLLLFKNTLHISLWTGCVQFLIVFTSS